MHDRSLSARKIKGQRNDDVASKEFQEIWNDKQTNGCVDDKQSVMRVIPPG